MGIKFDRKELIEIADYDTNAFFATLLRVMNERDPCEFKKNKRLADLHWEEIGERRPNAITFKAIKDAGRKNRLDLSVNVQLSPEGAQTRVAVVISVMVDILGGRFQNETMWDQMRSQMEPEYNRHLVRIIDCVRLSFSEIVPGLSLASQISVQASQEVSPLPSTPAFAQSINGAGIALCILGACLGLLIGIGLPVIYSELFHGGFMVVGYILMAAVIAGNSLTLVGVAIVKSNQKTGVMLIGIGALVGGLNMITVYGMGQFNKRK